MPAARALIEMTAVTSGSASDANHRSTCGRNGVPHRKVDFLNCSLLSHVDGKSRNRALVRFRRELVLNCSTATASPLLASHIYRFEAAMPR
jgi:hypothetical protein